MRSIHGLGSWQWRVHRDTRDNWAARRLRRKLRWIAEFSLVAHVDPTQCPSHMASYHDLVDRVRAGDRDAFDQVAIAFWQPVLGYFWRRAPAANAAADADADDLTQTVFVNTYQAILRGGGDGLRDEESFAKYLFGVARNLLRDHWRTTRSEESAVGEPADDDDESFAESIPDPRPPQDQLETAEQREALDFCLDQLETSGRQLAWMHFVEGRSKRDIARETDRPESSLRVDMVRVLARLRACIEGKGVTL